MSDSRSNETYDLSEFGREMWSYLTGREAEITYTFQDMRIDVPRRTGADSPGATWTLNGSLRITTSDRDNPRQR